MKQLELHLPSAFISAIIVLSMVGMYCLGAKLAEVVDKPLKNKDCAEGYTELVMMYPEYGQRFRKCVKDEINPVEQPKGRKR